MVIPVSIFIINIDLYLLIELIMNEKIKNKTGISITPLYKRSAQISGNPGWGYIPRQNLVPKYVKRPFPNWISTIVENNFSFFALSTNSKCNIWIGFAKEIIISFELSFSIRSENYGQKREPTKNRSRFSISECFLSLLLLKQIHVKFLQAYEIEFRKLNYRKMEYQYGLGSLQWFSKLFNSTEHSEDFWKPAQLTRNGLVK